mgnify:CR=1 FL=1
MNQDTDTSIPQDERHPAPAPTNPQRQMNSAQLQRLKESRTEHLLEYALHLFVA